MNGPAPRDEAILIDLVGRIMLTHAIDPAYAMRLLAIDRAEALAMIDTGLLWAPLGVVRRERLWLFANILIRLEWRFHHDSRAIRCALEAPIGGLSGAAPADLLGGTLTDLRAVRRAIDDIAAPTVK